MPKGVKRVPMTREEIIADVNARIPYVPGQGHDCIARRTKEIKRLFGIHKIPVLRDHKRDEVYISEFE